MPMVLTLYSFLRRFCSSINFSRMTFFCLDSCFMNLFVNGFYGLKCSFWIFFRDVIVNVMKPLFCFVGPFDEECLGSRSFEEIWRGDFK